MNNLRNLWDLSIFLRPKILGSMEAARNILNMNVKTHRLGLICPLTLEIKDLIKFPAVLGEVGISPKPEQLIIKGNLLDLQPFKN